MAGEAAVVWRPVVVFDEMFMMPIREPDGSWTVLSTEDMTFWKSADDVDRFADELEANRSEREPNDWPHAVEGYRALAALMRSPMLRGIGQELS